jgi:hypothetical protein
MNMTLSRKFAKFAGAGALGLSMLAAAGCSSSPSDLSKATPQQITDTQKAQGVYADACVVVDRMPGHPYAGGPWSDYNAYDFRNGVLLLGTTNSGGLTRAAAAVPISGLNESGKAHAMEMYNKLPATAKCEAPKLGK